MGQAQHAGGSALHQLATGGHGSELLKSWNGKKLQD
jgi:hypothetical protein